MYGNMGFRRDYHWCWRNWSLIDRDHRSLNQCISTWHFTEPCAITFPINSISDYYLTARERQNWET